MEEIKIDYSEKYEKLLNTVLQSCKDVKEEIGELKKYFEYVIQNMEEDDDFIDDDDEAIEVADDEEEPKPFIKKFSKGNNNSYESNYKKNIGSNNYSKRTFKKARKSNGFSNSNKNNESVGYSRY